MLQLLAPILSSLGGGFVGLIEAFMSAKQEASKVQAERELNQQLAQSDQLEKFYSSHKRDDEPKPFSWKFLGFSGNGHKYVAVPSRKQQFICMLIMTLAYAFVVGMAVVNPSCEIISFAASPESVKWINLLGLFSLRESTVTPVYALTLGGILLPLLSPFFFCFTRYVTGTSSSKL